jgi:hypothetical protein
MKDDQMKEKKCTKCGEVKPMEDFEENPYSPDGRYLVCMVCFNQHLKESFRIAESAVNDQPKKQPDVAVPSAGMKKKSVKTPSPPPPPPPPLPPTVKVKDESLTDEKKLEAIRQAQREVLSDKKEASLQGARPAAEIAKMQRLQESRACGESPSGAPKTGSGMVL